MDTPPRIAHSQQFAILAFTLNLLIFHNLRVKKKSVLTLHR